MIRMTNCEIRKCKHDLGVLKKDKYEKSEKPYCEAFPDGIPKEIAYGEIKHLTRHPMQKNDIVYEREEEDSNG